MFAFENTEDFAIDKPAGTPCPHLSSDRRCNIHDSRAKLGFSGCIKFDCHGAGQRVTQDVFAGKSWQDDAALILPMLHAFEAMRRVVDMEDLLAAAGKLPLKINDQAELDTLNTSLSAYTPWTQETLAKVRSSDLPARIKTFVASLKNYLPNHK